KVSDLMNHERPVSLYFIITPANQDRLNPLARLLLTRIVQSLADKMLYDDSGRSRSPHKHRLLLMLDEFPTLGKLEIFENA
ncbi:type IV secretory system conjugative DNA transfer family protein, partial [Escherichia coli]|uniref:type IV secretory system conjugative DNA transfer family protein n=1 Tax=Escherichia coli TaxID=562 RepID=UPI0028DEBF66